MGLSRYANDFRSCSSCCAGHFLLGAERRREISRGWVHISCFYRPSVLDCCIRRTCGFRTGSTLPIWCWNGSSKKSIRNRHQVISSRLDCTSFIKTSRLVIFPIRQRKNRNIVHNINVLQYRWGAAFLLQVKVLFSSHVNCRWKCPTLTQLNQIEKLKFQNILEEYTFFFISSDDQMNMNLYVYTPRLIT